MKKTPTIEFAFIFALYTLLLAPSVGAQTSSPSQSQAHGQSSSGQSSSGQSSPAQSSLGDYARKVKDANAPKAKPKVYDNDNLPTDDKLSVVGQPASTTAAEASSDANTAASKPASASDEDKAKKDAASKEWQQKITSQKDQIDLASRELDVTQREYQLRAAAMYADTGNRLRNEAQWDKQDADYKQKIADKQKAIDDAKQKLTEMQEDARKAGVPSSAID